MIDIIPIIRELVRTYQAFEMYSSQHIRTLNLTPSQFDVIVTLGNQPPMTCKLLGEMTLITKGTLTGVLDRLEAKGLIIRIANKDDARSQKLALTAEGDIVFNEVFPSLKKYFESAAKQLSADEVVEIVNALQKFKAILTKPD
jgi:MarR family transcriptional regulator, 2-MHQ and catechol-resistance regulon repressor